MSNIAPPNFNSPLAEGVGFTNTSWYIFFQQLAQGVNTAGGGMSYSVFGASGTNHASGLVPDPGPTAGASRFLCENATFSVPPIGPSYSVFGPSGTGHGTGLVPDPGAAAGQVRYLREDASFDVPPGTTLTFEGPTFGVAPSFTIPLLSAFTLRSAVSGTTLTQPIANGPVVLNMITSSGNQMQMVTVPAPATPWTKTFLLEWDGGIDPAQLSGFVILYNNATTALIWCGWNGNTVYIQYWSNPTTPGATIQTFARGRPVCSSYWLRVTFDGTNITFYGSKNNVDWWIIGTSFTLASTSLGQITDVGFGMNAITSIPMMITLWNLQ
jgi:hypothetical protein